MMGVLIHRNDYTLFLLAVFDRSYILPTKSLVFTTCLAPFALHGSFDLLNPLKLRPLTHGLSVAECNTSQQK